MRETEERKTMDFALTEEQELLLESVDELMERYGTEQYFKECDEKHEWPTGIYRRAARKRLPDARRR